MAPTANPSLLTRAAAAYLTERGIQASASYLQKARARGADDPRDHGPDFFRDRRGICWYERTALDRYITQRLQGRQFRSVAPQPANFRKAGAK